MSIISKHKTGFLLINKPVDWTSHDVVGYIRGVVRKATGDKKIRVGHAGTLDPFATGLLIVGIGREATKRIDEFKNMKKNYVATIKLGATSDTYDKTGEIKQVVRAGRDLSQQDIDKVLQSFLGKQKQTPPMYSAKKVQGKKLYELARKGIEIERKPNEIEIYNIKLVTYDPKSNSLKIKTEVSTGTYIRTIAHDIGQKLGFGAYCEELKRTEIGEYDLTNAVGPKDITKENWEKRLI
ncbi:tRNA pseudouridine(55) synthase TruB [Candidatus Parcubacteria bacterium]|jgi:tRNA pseudouridine55 synthase|nr:tRNA pseudouridine(55) synthase TruB [Candidatus Parcubacteria bacterium]MBT3948932.1 tRNA pseudouridine(55) synthase TruB [Candidatus Parcubacteria bacterium]